MKKALIGIGLLIVAGIIVISQVNARERTARVNFIKGKVFYKAKSVGKWKRLNSIGSRLKESDSLKTGENSKVEIRFDDGSLLQLTSNSSILLKNYKLTRKGRSSDVNLKKGSIFANVKKLKRSSSFQVSTVTAVAGVRGTEFYVSIDNKDKVDVEVYKGKVAVAGQTAKGAVDVKAGQKTEVGKNSSPNRPKKLLKPRRIEWSE